MACVCSKNPPNGLPKNYLGFFFPLFGWEFLVLPNFEILLAVYFRKAALVFLKNMNSMNPREPAIGCLPTLPLTYLLSHLKACVIVALQFK